MTREGSRDRRTRRHRLLAGLALSLAALGLPLLLRKLAAVPPLPPHGWGRGRRYVWRGNEVTFQQVGDGPPLVLVHSLGPGHDGDEWQRVAEALARDHDVTAPDLPGWGLSARCALRPTPALYAAFLLAFLGDVVRRPAVLAAAGRSASFAIAAAAAARPGAVRALVLVGPFGLGADAEGPEGPRALRRGLARLSRLPGLPGSAVQLFTTRAAIQGHLEEEVFAAPERADAARRERWYRSARQRGAQRALLAYLDGELAEDVSALLPRLQVPVWIGWGRQAVAPPVETADLWLHHLPGAELEVFDGSGALPHLELPTEFVQRLRPFLQRT
jgi:pimeloyl-ACP methyl ester carboxylesterase